MEQVKVVLQDREIPKKWYNIMADLPTPMKPPLHPGTGKPVTPSDLAAIFPMNIIAAGSFRQALDKNSGRSLAKIFALAAVSSLSRL